MMGSGKTYFVEQLKKISSNLIYLNLDDFRRSIIELENIKPFIYSDINIMNKYKQILYQNFKNHLKTIDKPIVVEWALIVEDNIVDLFDFIVIIETDKKKIINRLKGGDLGIVEVNKRLNLQLNTNDKISKLMNKKYIIVKENYNTYEVLKILEGEIYGMQIFNSK